MTKKNIYIGIVVVLIASVILEVLFAHPHTNAFWDVIPGFDLLFGVGGALLLIGLAKGILGPLMQKDEDHYDQGGDES